MSRCTGLRMMVLVVAASLFAPLEAIAVPPRRLARRGVIVVPPPGADAVLVPTPGAAPVVVGPAVRPRRRMMLQTAPLAVPGAPGVAAAAPSSSGRLPAVHAPAPSAASVPTKTQAAVATPAMAPSSATASAAAKPAAAAPESIPAPRPTPADSPFSQSAAAASPAIIAFTPDWFAKHPEAWRPTTSPSDWWNSADAAAITSWLGQPINAAGTAADPVGGVATAGAADVGDDGLRSVLVLPAGHQNGANATDADWLPLGVFAVVPAGTQDSGQAHNFQQLAVDRKGTIKGNFYDTLSGTIQPITGTVDRTTLVASWTVGANGSRFTAPMRSFTGQPRTASVSTGGQTRDLQLMPVQRP